MNELTYVKQVAAILYQNRSDFEGIIPELESRFSKIDFQGSFFPFVETDYYEPEMGSDLVRGMISFEKPIHPGTLSQAKHQARHLEDSIRQSGNRLVNIDIGYMDLFKVVLASFKGRSNKIYLDNDVWADMICYFDEGTYKTFMWGFPDFKSGIYNKDLVTIRSIYKQQLRGLRESS